MLSGIKKYIDYISLSRAQLNGHAICPYAKKFIKDVFIKETDDIENEVKYFVTNFPENYKVVLVISDYKNHQYKNLVDICDSYQNDKLWLAPDHPNQYNEISGIQTNNEHYAMILIQDRQHLTFYSDKLKETDYYEYWSKDYYDEIVTDREMFNMKEKNV